MLFFVAAFVLATTANQIVFIQTEVGLPQIALTHTLSLALAFLRLLPHLPVTHWRHHPHLLPPPKRNRTKSIENWFRTSPLSKVCFPLNRSLSWWQCWQRATTISTVPLIAWLKKDVETVRFIFSSELKHHSRELIYDVHVESFYLYTFRATANT